MIKLYFMSFSEKTYGEIKDLENMFNFQEYLFTEASFYSYPLFLKLGWILIAPEKIKIGGITFERLCGVNSSGSCGKP